MHPFDHAFLVVLALVQPICGALAVRRFVAAGGEASRARLYFRTLTLEWLTLGVLLTAWVVLERPAAALGLTVPGGAGFLTGAALVLLLVALLIRSWSNVRAMGEGERGRQVAALGRLVRLLPQTKRDLRHFTVLSITAGIVEELIYRGFVLWYLALYMPLWAAVAASSAIFGLAHSYQGVAGALRTAVVGLVFAILYVVSGSIWLPILAHAALDILQGAMIFEILRRSPEATGVRAVRANS